MSITGGMRALWCSGRGQNQRVKSLSCGILVLNPQSQLLLCHATGTFVWDIPKGGGEAGETPLQTALRETAEECGLRFEPAELLELGRFAYRPAKDLHLFAALVYGVEARDCHCSSHFSDAWGRRRPEMDGFEWTAFERVHRRCARRMAEVLTQRLSLPRVLQQLQQRKLTVPSGAKA
jgi:8-oxo-dGTP pyrophosphatase MutT (NUDIX family)